MTSAGSAFFFNWIGGDPDPTPPASPRGTANNMFIEDNTINIVTMTNAGAACSDSWGGAAVVWRHNTTFNCLVASHGALHAGGPQNWEYYNNTQRLGAGSDTQGVADGYRQFHHQGSGEFIAFNNFFLPLNSSIARNTDVIAMMYYRDEATLAASEGGAVCDGTQSIDGNRQPTTTYHGYRCWHQPGRDFANNLQPMYSWGNKWADTGAKIDLTLEDYGGYHANHFVDNRDYYNAVGGMQISPTTPFNGTTGMGYGTLANRPTTCSTGLTDLVDAGKGGVGYFATDVGSQGTLFQCSSPNTWTAYYQPYTYPHPLTQAAGGDRTPPSVPTGLSATVISSAQINLTWTASTDNVGVAGFRVYRGSALVGTVPGTSYSDSGLTAATAYSYTVAAYDAAGNMSAHSASVSATTRAAAVVAPSNLTVSSSTTSGVAPLTVNFVASANGTSPVCNWTLGNGATATGTTASATYTSAGTYTVTVVASNSAGSVSISRTVTVTAPPVVVAPANLTVSSSTTSGVAPLTVNFAASASGTNPVFNWTLGNGATATGATASDTYTSAGIYTVTVVVSNSAGSVSKSSAVTVTVTAPPTAGSYTLWSSAAMPANAAEPDGNAVNLGVKFKATQNGHITGIRFYKGTGNNGTHTVALWSSQGAKLATAVATNETASGWQQVNLTTPVAITAGTVYVASYYAPNGHYADDMNYFANQSISQGPLTALQNGASGPNGIYIYGSTVLFPQSGYYASNYWVDVVFTP
jgi:PKD repeat protein